MRRIPTRNPIGTLAKASDETTKAIVPAVSPEAIWTTSAAAMVASATPLVASTGARTRRAASDAARQRSMMIATTAARSTTPITAAAFDTAAANLAWCDTSRTFRGAPGSLVRSSDEPTSVAMRLGTSVSRYAAATMTCAVRDSSRPRGYARIACTSTA